MIRKTPTRTISTIGEAIPQETAEKLAQLYADLKAGAK